MAEKLYSSAQVAAIVNIPLPGIDRALGEGVNQLRRPPRGKKWAARKITATQLLYMRLEVEGVQRFSRSLRQDVANALGADPTADVLTIPSCPVLVLNLTNARRHIEEAENRLQRAQDLVVPGPEEQKGRPVFRGTQISVDDVAELISHGASTDAILARYPDLSREQAELAPLYIAAFPRRGPRPGLRERRRAYWKARLAEPRPERPKPKRRQPIPATSGD
jgi:uncharacterized protein (DUF433 family)